MAEYELTFDGSAHTADAIQRAVYRLSDRLSAEVRFDGNHFHCNLHVFAAETGEGPTILDEFRNEVIDQVLRARIRTETELTRNLILSLAFSQTGLGGPAGGDTVLGEGETVDATE